MALLGGRRADSSNFGAQRLSGIHIRCALVDKNSSISGAQNIGLTTNSILVEKMASSLARAGLKRVNISPDILKPV